jgi:hypothetical protein
VNSTLAAGAVGTYVWPDLPARLWRL